MTDFDELIRAVNALKRLLRPAPGAEAAEAKLPALAEPVGDAEVKRLVEWLISPLFEGEDAPVEHAEAAFLIRRLASSLATARLALDAIQEPTTDAVWLRDIARRALATLNQPEKADDADAG